MAAGRFIREARLLTLTMVVLAVMGLSLAGGGLWLMTLGGSSYYLIAGLALLAAIISPSSTLPRPGPLCPPPRIATLRSFCLVKFTAVTTSATSVHRAIISGL